MLIKKRKKNTESPRAQPAFFWGGGGLSEKSADIWRVLFKSSLKDTALFLCSAALLTLLIFFKKTTTTVWMENPEGYMGGFNAQI